MLFQFIIALSILAAISTITALNLHQEHGLLLKATSRNVVSYLDNCAELARITGTPVSISPDIEHNSFTSSHPLNLSPAGRPPCSRLQLPSQVKIHTFRFGSINKLSQQLTLRPSGTATPGRIILQQGTLRSCTVIQSLRGLRTLRCISKESSDDPS